jgi:hypothetical protein
MDAGNWEPAELRFEAMTLNPEEKGRRGRQDAGNADQGWAKPQDEGKQRLMMHGRSKQILPDAVWPCTTFTRSTI